MNIKKYLKAIKSVVTFFYEERQTLHRYNLQLQTDFQQLCTENQQLCTEKQQLSAEKQQLVEKFHSLSACSFTADQSIQQQIEDFAKSVDVKIKEEVASADTYVDEALKSKIAALAESNPNKSDVPCKICGNSCHACFTGKVMNRHEVFYYWCEHCNHLQTEEPYWLEEAYRMPLSKSDTGILLRNDMMRDVVVAVSLAFFEKGIKILEYAGGHGVLTRMMRDRGFDCRWYDKYAVPTFAYGFEDKSEMKYDLTTIFEALEHFQSPMEELSSIFTKTDSILFSQEVIPAPLPTPDSWWYYCLEHGQHVNFYSIDTLRLIAKKLNKRFYFHNRIGLFTSKEIDEELFKKVIENSHAISEGAISLCGSKSFEDMNFIQNLLKEEA